MIIFCLLSLFVFSTGKQIETIDENNRKAELRYSLNSSIEDTFNKYFLNTKGEKIDVEEMMMFFNSHFKEGINSEGVLKVRLIGCDSENGILYIGVENTYKNVFGMEGKLSCEKALMLEEF